MVIVCRELGDGGRLGGGRRARVRIAAGICMRAVPANCAEIRKEALEQRPGTRLLPLQFFGGRLGRGGGGTACRRELYKLRPAPGNNPRARPRRALCASAKLRGYYREPSLAS